TDDLFVGKTLLHGDVLMWLMKTLLTSGCTNQRGAGQLHKGISEGCNCLGYHMWTFIDNWSWCNAYKNRYGFIQLDVETQQRTIKKSGEWFAATALNNSFDKE
ncbi:family 1 glycosylhydrolase, partial [Enterobacter hormaechei]